MFGLLVIGAITFGIIQFFKHMQDDLALDAAKELVPYLDIYARFNADYQGYFSLDEPLPDEQKYRSVKVLTDKNIEYRLAFHLHESLPKWMLEKSLADYRAGTLDEEAIHHLTLTRFLDEFVKRRTACVIDLLNGETVPISPSNLLRRRKRRRR